MHAAQTANGKRASSAANIFHFDGCIIQRSSANNSFCPESCPFLIRSSEEPDASHLLEPPGRKARMALSLRRAMRRAKKKMKRRERGEEEDEGDSEEELSDDEELRYK
jgi:hypothetical protein